MNADTVLISAEGAHEAPGIAKPYLMIVDGKSALIDLSNVQGSLTDPSIARVEWGMIQDGKEVRAGGYIVRTDGSKTPFFDKQAILPYVLAFDARLAELQAAANG